MIIYFLFKPTKIVQQKFVDVPQLVIRKFTLYELDTKGLQTFMTGDKAERFKDRYIVDAIDYTDNSKKLVSNMVANYGMYKDDVVDLEGNVTYVRADGITFKSNRMAYNTLTKIATTKEPYTAQKGESEMSGRSLTYNALLKQMKSRKVAITYKLN